MLYPRSVTYAIDSLSFLAGYEPNTFIKVKTIASELGIPEHYLGKIFTSLVRKKITISAKGPTGGVALAQDPAKLTLYAILEALDALEQIEENCVLGLNSCSGDESCPFHNEWGQFRDKLSSIARKTTLASLVKH
ncbi:MAG: Rrf2 family transcriptional regulator [candidate division Zixibacteria bacterium]|nr:Rrf2 family transcriptional regulator [candidate division Zixibacteria bacterium]